MHILINGILQKLETTLCPSFSFSLGTLMLPTLCIFLWAPSNSSHMKDNVEVIHFHINSRGA